MPTNESDVAIIGAGIIGCSIGWELLNRGIKVVLIDTHSSPFQGISSAGFGSLTPYSDPFFKGEAQKFASMSVDLYRSEWISRISKEANIEIPVCDDGLIELFSSKKLFNKWKIHAQKLNLYRDGIARILSVEETRELEPNLTGKYIGALWLDEPWIDKTIYFEALEKILRKSLLDSLICNTEVASISESHKTLIITTKNNTTFTSKYVVVCTGLTASAIEGLPPIPILKWIRGDAIGVHTKDDKPLLNRHIYMNAGFITPRKNGFMLLGATYEEEDGLPFEHCRSHRNRISLSNFQSLIKFNTRIIPSLKDCEISHVWRGWRPTPLDKMPVLGTVAGYPNIIMANGFIGLGITMAPAVAKSIGDYLIDNKKDSFPRMFDPNRFNLV